MDAPGADGRPALDATVNAAVDAVTCRRRRAAAAPDAAGSDVALGRMFDRVDSRPVDGRWPIGERLIGTFHGQRRGSLAVTAAFDYRTAVPAPRAAPTVGPLPLASLEIDLRRRRAGLVGQHRAVDLSPLVRIGVYPLGVASPGTGLVVTVSNPLMFFDATPTRVFARLSTRLEAWMYNAVHVSDVLRKGVEVLVATQEGRLLRLEFGAEATAEERLALPASLGTPLPSHRDCVATAPVAGPPTPPAAGVVPERCSVNDVAVLDVAVWRVGPPPGDAATAAELAGGSPRVWLDHRRLVFCPLDGDRAMLAALDAPFRARTRGSADTGAGVWQTLLPVTPAGAAVAGSANGEIGSYFTYAAFAAGDGGVLNARPSPLPPHGGGTVTAAVLREPALASPRVCATNDGARVAVVWRVVCDGGAAGPQHPAWAPSPAGVALEPLYRLGFDDHPDRPLAVSAAVAASLPHAGDADGTAVATRPRGVGAAMPYTVVAVRDGIFAVACGATVVLIDADAAAANVAAAGGDAATTAVPPATAPVVDVVDFPPPPLHEPPRGGDEAEYLAYVGDGESNMLEVVGLAATRDGAAICVATGVPACAFAAAAATATAGDGGGHHPASAVTVVPVRPPPATLRSLAAAWVRAHRAAFAPDELAALPTADDGRAEAPLCCSRCGRHGAVAAAAGPLLCLRCGAAHAHPPA